LGCILLYHNNHFSPYGDITYSNLSHSLDSHVRRSNESGEFSVLSDFIIKSLDILRRGKRGWWQWCPNGTYAAGFQLKVEPISGVIDKSGVNGIKLFCAVAGSNSYLPSNEITSKVGDFGRWLNVFRCNDGFLTGLSLQVHLAPPGDDSYGATNLRMACSNPATKVLQGDGHDVGFYSPWQTCDARQAICGIHTWVEEARGEFTDDTGLVKVHMKCCDIPEPGKDCKPDDNWVERVVCTNSNPTPLLCEYIYGRGVKHTKAQENGGSKEWETMLTVGFSTTLSVAGIESSFSASYGQSVKTGLSWSSQSSDTWEEEKMVKLAFRVPGHRKQTLWQVVGTCGNFSIGSVNFRVTDAPI